MSIEGVLASVIIITLVFLALVWRILAQIRVLGPGLILLGLVTAMAAMCYGAFGSGIGAQSMVPGQGGAAVFAVGAAAGQSGILMKIGVILVLAGIAACLMADWAPLSSSQSPERTGHVEQR